MKKLEYFPENIFFLIFFQPSQLPQRTPFVLGSVWILHRDDSVVQSAHEERKPLGVLPNPDARILSAWYDPECLAKPSRGPRSEYCRQGDEGCFLGSQMVLRILLHLRWVKFSQNCFFYMQKISKYENFRYVFREAKISRLWEWSRIVQSRRFKHDSLQWRSF